MPIIKIQIEVEGLPENYEAIAYRENRKGEACFVGGELFTDTIHTSSRLIVRERYAPPAWVRDKMWLICHKQTGDWRITVDPCVGGGMPVCRTLCHFDPPPFSPYQVDREAAKLHTIEIADKLIPHDYEIVKYGKPVSTDATLRSGRFYDPQSGSAYGGPALILRKIYTPPDWAIPGTWFFQGRNNNWFVSTEKPSPCGSGFYTVGSASKYMAIQPECIRGFVEPPTNLYQVPEKKGE